MPTPPPSSDGPKADGEKLDKALDSSSLSAQKPDDDAVTPKTASEVSVRVKLVSPPLYVLTSTCLEKSVGISTLETAIERIRSSITAAGGGIEVKMAPKAVTEGDETALAALMEKKERENMEVSGDEDESESDEG